jgi:hypothetical protein
MVPHIEETETHSSETHSTTRDDQRSVSWRRRRATPTTAKLTNTAITKSGSRSWNNQITKTQPWSPKSSGHIHQNKSRKSSETTCLPEGLWNLIKLNTFSASTHRLLDSLMHVLYSGLTIILLSDSIFWTNSTIMDHKSIFWTIHTTLHVSWKLAQV